MSGFRGRWMAAARLTIEAGLAALGGRIDEAIASYDRALRSWHDLDSPLDLALCELDMALLLDTHPAAVDAAKRARELLTDLGATPLIERLSGAPSAADDQRDNTGGKVRVD